MTLQEKIALDLVLLAIIAVYILAVWAIFRLIVEKFAGIEKEQRFFFIWLRRLSLFFALIGLFCFSYAYFIEPYWLEVRKIEIHSQKLPKGLQPIRIVHISDIHSDSFARLEEELPITIAEQKPDLIVFSGDSLNSPDGLPIFRNCLTKISQIAPTFVVRGNWDVWYWKEQDLFGGINVKQLNGNAEKIEVRGTPVWLTGVFVESEGKLTNALSSIPKNEFSIFVTHYPDLIEEVVTFEVDLYCAGHTHGGQVAMPFYGALVTLSKFGKRFEGGTYQVGKTTLNVNRGIGMEGGITPRVRFLARPEITVIDILPI